MIRNSGNPITAITLGPNGRVEKLMACIKKNHLRPLGQKRRNITERVRRFVEALGQVRGGVKGIRESDEVGHIIADLLGGPHDLTFNFFPQSPQCNLEYYNKVEKRIYDYLKNARYSLSSVTVIVEMVYVDYISGISPDRPRMIKVSIMFSDGTFSHIKLSNM